MADTTKPTVLSVTDDVTGVANLQTTAVHYVWNFSEPVTGLEVADFSVQNGAVTAVTGSGTQWAVTVAPNRGVNTGVLGVTLKADAVTDVDGNTNLTYTDSSQSIDTLAPVAPKLVSNASVQTTVNPQVTFTVRVFYNSTYYYPEFVFELYPNQAPASVANFLTYVEDDFYYGTIFHRVISGFMVQAGGLTTGLASKAPTYAPIVLESNNGLSNLRGTVAMARTNDPNSATSQFYVNVVDNKFLDYTSSASPGYAVFGKVVSGMDVLDYIASVATATYGSYQNVPTSYLYIMDAIQTKVGQSGGTNVTFNLSDTTASSTWQYSLDAGLHWQNGSGTVLSIPDGHYAANAIQIRQVDEHGNTSVNTFSSTLNDNPPTGGVFIEGCLRVGQTVSVSQNLFDADGLGQFSYQWYANGVAISGASSSQYTLTTAEIGQSVQVTIRYTDGQGAGEWVGSQYTFTSVVPAWAGTQITQPNFFASLTPSTPSFSVEQGVVAKVNDAVGEQTITIQKGGKLDLDGSLGANKLVFADLATTDVSVYRFGQEAHVIWNTSHEVIASIPITASAQVLRFTDGDKTLQMSSGPKFDGKSIASYVPEVPATPEAGWYMFDTVPTLSGVRQIADFVSGQQKIVLDDKAFSALQGDSNLSDNLWVKDGTTLQDQNDFLVFDVAASMLFYDADGSGSGSPVAFVQLVGAAAAVTNWSLADVLLI